MAPELLNRAAEDAIDAADGYAARDIICFREPIDGITDNQRSNLSRLAAESGLGIGKLPEPSLLRLITGATDAAAALNAALSSSSRTETSAATP